MELKWVWIVNFATRKWKLRGVFGCLLAKSARGRLIPVKSDQIFVEILMNICCFSVFVRSENDKKIMMFISIYEKAYLRY